MKIYVWGLGFRVSGLWALVGFRVAAFRNNAPQPSTPKPTVLGSGAQGLNSQTRTLNTPCPKARSLNTRPSGASEGVMKVGKVKDPLYKDSRFGIASPTFIPPLEP